MNKVKSKNKKEEKLTAITTNTDTATGTDTAQDDRINPNVHVNIKNADIPIIDSHDLNTTTTTTTTTTTSNNNKISSGSGGSSSSDTQLQRCIRGIQENDTDTESEAESSYGSSSAASDLVNFWKRDYNDLSWRCRWLELQIRDIQYQGYLCDQLYQKLRKSKQKIEKVEVEGMMTVVDEETGQEEEIEMSGSLRTDGMVLPKKLRRMIKRQPAVLRKRQIRKETETHPLYTLDKQYYKFESQIKQSAFNDNKEEYGNRRPKRPRVKRYDQELDERLQVFESESDGEINILTDPPPRPPKISLSESLTQQTEDSVKNEKSRRRGRKPAVPATTAASSSTANSSATKDNATPKRRARSSSNLEKQQQQKIKGKDKEKEKEKDKDKHKEKERDKDSGKKQPATPKKTNKKKKEEEEVEEIPEEEEVIEDDDDDFDDDYSSYDDELSTSESSSSDSDSGFYNRKKRRDGGTSSFDVVLNIGSNFHIPVVQYKEIITPEWREVAASTILDNRQQNLSLPSPLILAARADAPTEYSLQPIVEQESEKTTDDKKATEQEKEKDNGKDNDKDDEAMNNQNINVHIDAGVVIPELSSINISTIKTKNEPQLKFTQIDESNESTNNDGSAASAEGNGEDDESDTIDDEDTDDEAIAKRHSQCEVDERYRFFKLIQSTPVSRRKKVTPEFTCTAEELLPSYAFSKKYIKLLGPTWHGDIRRKKKHHHRHHHHKEEEVADGDGTDDEQEKQHLRRRKLTRIKSTGDITKGKSTSEKTASTPSTPMRTRSFTRQQNQQHHKQESDDEARRKLVNNRSASTPNLQTSATPRKTRTPRKKNSNANTQDQQDEDTAEDNVNETENANAWWNDNSFIWKASVLMTGQEENKPPEQDTYQPTPHKPLLLRLKRVKSESNIATTDDNSTNPTTTTVQSQLQQLSQSQPSINININNNDSTLITTTTTISSTTTAMNNHLFEQINGNTTTSGGSNNSISNDIKDSFLVNQIDKATEIANKGKDIEMDDLDTTNIKSTSITDKIMTTPEVTDDIPMT